MYKCTGGDSKYFYIVLNTFKLPQALMNSREHIDDDLHEFTLDHNMAV